MRQTELFVQADRALDGVVAQVRDDQWQMEMPESFFTRSVDRRPTLREILNYHAYDDAWVPDMLAGRTMDEVGRDLHRGDLLADDPRARFAEIDERACAAALAVEDLDFVVHASFGDFPARGYLWQVTSFRAFRAHELARILGLDPTLPAGLVQALWDEFLPRAEEMRGLGVFREPVPVPDDAPLQDRLIALTGRQP
ncbi:MAG: TIGR03086 family protein [Chloroflexi bacterium]|nr:MAG: TIGR03086 family protein [Chloroflexota bacterium]